jgi:DNA-binding NtrC family response regulator
MKGRVLVLERRGSRLGLDETLRAQGYEIVQVESADASQAPLAQGSLDAVLVACSAVESALVLAEISRIRDASPALPVVLVAANAGEQFAIAALKLGVADYFKWPATAAELCAALDGLCAARPVVQPALGFQGIIGQSASINRVREYLDKVAASDANLLITGETGTGKELVAEMVHAASRRRRNAFVCVNCAALPDTLVESELFGYERGAFTGANATNDGKLRQAHGGTMFFDEIGEMNCYAQAKILRAIESRHVQRLGGKAEIPVDIRIIAATNQELETLVEQNRFRKDLYFRLNVARVHLPPLRERRDDVGCLVRHYIRHFNRHTGQSVEDISPDALDVLTRYEWPGNVRELRNTIEAVFVNRPHQCIDVQDLPDRIATATWPAAASDRERLMRALTETQWNKSKAAEKLCWSRMTLYRKMLKYGIRDSEKTMAGGR